MTDMAEARENETQVSRLAADGQAISRRAVLRLAGVGSLGVLGVALSACSPAPSAPTAAPQPTSTPAPKPTEAPA